jgi:MFS family permease
MPGEKASPKVSKYGRGSQKLLIAVSLPFVMAVLYQSMFELALPSLRILYQIPPDTTAWLVTAYVLPYLIFMPVYGLLGDRFGKRILFVAGILVFLLGTGLLHIGGGLRMILIGRILQGIGASGIHPLCIAVISDCYSSDMRGNALGRWNAIGSLASMSGPLIGGFIIDYFGWQMIQIPAYVVAGLAMAVVWTQIPRMVQSGNQSSGLAKNSSAGKDNNSRPFTFDWPGLMLLAPGLTALLFYVSSRPITGVGAFQDWRLLAAAALLLGLFVARELRAQQPLISLAMFRFRNFTPASICSGVRMFLFGAFAFLMPLYLREVRGLSAGSAGLLLTVHYLFLFFIMLLGGKLSDLGMGRILAVIGFIGQTVFLSSFALLQPGSPTVAVLLLLIAHGLALGSYLPALHKASMSHVPRHSSGKAAGLYSMIRYSGSLVGPALAGVLLQKGLDAGPVAEAYKTAFLAMGAVGIVGIVFAFRIRR